MRLVTYGAACSLDGFITGPNGALDWLHFSKDAQDVMGAYWPTVDTVLMGRRTWEVANGGKASARKTGGEKPSGGKSAAKRKRAKSAGGISTYVFSRTLSDDDVPGAEVVRENAGEFVRALKAQPGRGICVMGGGDLARSLFEAGVIDEVGLNIHPILLGAGTPLFLNAGRIALTLTECRTLDGGCVLANYRVNAS